jgi:hypothetical protein
MITRLFWRVFNGSKIGISELQGDSTLKIVVEPITELSAFRGLIEHQ